tara:strand:+ start:464 stop:1015 length:552 start_codon:yes stop_codon:yes gene_type:complete
MHKVKVYAEGVARAWPVIIIIVPFLSYFLTNDIDLLLLSIMLTLVDKIITPFLKNYIFKNLMGTKNYPILGTGKRPKGAKDTGCFLTKNNEISNTYGMPSGHATSAWFFSIYTINKILDSSMNQITKIVGISLFISLGLGIMHSRVKFRCHTIQQVILGGIFGSIFGKLYYDNKNTIKFFLNI